jgi:hypothetical protein
MLIPRNACWRMLSGNFGARNDLRNLSGTERRTIPRQYRELLSNGETRKLLDRKIVAQNGKC